MICHVESIILSASLGKSNLVSKGKQVSFPINACRVFFFFRDTIDCLHECAADCNFQVAVRPSHEPIIS